MKIVSIPNKKTYKRTHDICLMLLYFAKVLEHWEQTKKIATKVHEKAIEQRSFRACEFDTFLTGYKFSDIQNLVLIN